MKALGSIIWDGIHSDTNEEIDSFLDELKARQVDPGALVWLLDANDGWYCESFEGLPYLGNVSKRMITEVSFSRKTPKI